MPAIKNNELTLAMLNHVSGWAKKLSRQEGWNKSDSQIAIAIEIIKKDMLHDRYLSTKKPL